FSRLVTNLILLAIGGIPVSFWLVWLANSLPPAGALVGLGVIIAWLALILKALPDRVPKRFQKIFYAMLLQDTLTPRLRLAVGGAWIVSLCMGGVAVSRTNAEFKAPLW